MAFNKRILLRGFIHLIPLLVIGIALIGLSVLIANVRNTQKPTITTPEAAGCYCTNTDQPTICDAASAGKPCRACVPGTEGNGCSGFARACTDITTGVCVSNGAGGYTCSESCGTGGTPAERVVGRVWLNGVAQTGYNLVFASSIGVTWGTNPEPYYYTNSRWLAGTTITASLTNPGSGKTCTWNFEPTPEGSGGETSGSGCTATITLRSGPNSPDWQNHLHFILVNAVTPTQAPSCQVSISPSSFNVIVGQQAKATANVTTTSTVSQVEFQGIGSFIVSLNPAIDSTKPYETTLTGQVPQVGKLRATATLSGGYTCSAEVPLTVTAATITPTLTPAPTSDCTNWGNDESSGTNSELTKFNSALTIATLVKTYPCSTGPCDFEGWDSHPVTNVLYAVAGSNKTLYTINTAANDNIADGTLTKIAPLSPAMKAAALAFRRSDNSLWIWRPGYGLYTLNLSTAATTLIFSSSLDHVAGLAWDNNSQYLYISRTPTAAPINATYELRRYDPVAKTISFVGALPGDTDALDFAPPGYLNGQLIGNYRVSGGVNFYTYDISTKAVTNYRISTPYRNIDAFAACIPNQ